MAATNLKATLTSKGQITLPKAIRQTLGVNSGDELSFELRDGQVILSRVDAEREDPAIGAFLDLLDKDIHQGKHIGSLPDDLAKSLLTNLGRQVAPDDDIEGEDHRIRLGQ